MGIFDWSSPLQMMPLPPPSAALMQMHQMQMDPRQLQQLGQAFAGGFVGVDPARPEEPYDVSELPYQNTFGEIVAWRSWKWKDGALVSPYKDTSWAAGEIIEAHESPFKGKNAGVFCHKTIEDVFHQEKENWQVVGTVLIWGDVMEHEKGYRAEFAKPYEIKHFHPDMQDTAKQYIEAVFNHVEAAP